MDEPDEAVAISRRKKRPADLAHALMLKGGSTRRSFLSRFLHPDNVPNNRNELAAKFLPSSDRVMKKTQKGRDSERRDRFAGTPVDSDEFSDDYKLPMGHGLA